MRFESRFPSRKSHTFCVALLVTLILSALSLAPSLSPLPLSAPARAQTTEYIATYAADCVTPKSVFKLGDTVCAKAGKFPGTASLGDGHRRFQWDAPDGTLAHQKYIKADPQTSTFVIPTTGDFAQVGTWHARTANQDATRYVRVDFIVGHPRTAFADLSVIKWGPINVLQGKEVIYRLRVANPGPDFAESVVLSDEVPNDMVFVAVKRASGPELECSTPAPGATGRTTCKGKGLAPHEVVELDFYYQVNREAKDGTRCRSTAEAFSSTEELNKEDNFSTYESVVGEQ